jgi:hypothetical protein
MSESGGGERKERRRSVPLPEESALIASDFPLKAHTSRSTGLVLDDEIERQVRR